MKEQPILFKGEMVRAILAGRKTQTRRLMNPQPSEWFYPSACGKYNPTITDKDGYEDAGPEIFGCYDKNGEDEGYKCKYEPGSRLWVKETFYKHATEKGPMFTGFYRATDEERKIKWRPSIFLPRWASRITLEIESVRVERLQDISESDAIEEGITWDEWSHDYIGAYRKLWESINGSGSWDANPWVWVIAFRKL